MKLDELKSLNEIRKIVSIPTHGIDLNQVVDLKIIKNSYLSDYYIEQGKIKEFKEIFLSQREKHKDLQDQLEDAFLQIKELQAINKFTIQKTGMVRFNPFNDMGGNQSFVIALLDGKNNGFVLSSLFIKEGNRVYAKAVKAGKSEHALSKEESEAISRAINSK